MKNLITKEIKSLRGSEINILRTLLPVSLSAINEKGIVKAVWWETQEIGKVNFEPTIVEKEEQEKEGRITVRRAVSNGFANVEINQVLDQLMIEHQIINEEELSIIDKMLLLNLDPNDTIFIEKSSQKRVDK